MKGWSAGQGTGSHSALLKKQEAAMKLQKQAAMKRMDSAMDKPLVGNQKNLPKHLQEKIEAAPMQKMKDKSSMKRMAPGDGSAKTKDKSTMKRMKNSPMHKDADPFFEAMKKDPNLRKLVEERNKHKKGTDEYAAAQNRINKAYENTKRHNVTSTTETKRGGKKEVTTTVTPGIGTKTEKTKRDAEGNIIKTKTDNVPDSYYKNEEATREKQKRGKDKEFGTEDDKKKKKKSFKGTKLGKFLGVGQGDKRKKRRQERRNPQKEQAEEKKGGPFARMKDNSSMKSRPKVKYNKQGGVRKKKFTDVDGNKVKVKYKKGSTKVKVGGEKTVLDPRTNPDKMQLYSKHLDSKI